MRESQLSTRTWPVFLFTSRDQYLFFTFYWHLNQNLFENYICTLNTDSFLFLISSLIYHIINNHRKLGFEHLRRGSLWNFTIAKLAQAGACFYCSLVDSLIGCKNSKVCHRNNPGKSTSHHVGISVMKYLFLIKLLIWNNFNYIPSFHILHTKSLIVFIYCCLTSFLSDPVYFLWDFLEIEETWIERDIWFDQWALAVPFSVRLVLQGCLCRDILSATLRWTATLMIYDISLYFGDFAWWPKIEMTKGNRLIIASCRV